MTCPRISDQLILVCNLSVLLVLNFFYLSPATADEVLIINGDRLTGEVIRQEAGVLKLKTSYAGTMEIEWIQVHEVILDEPGQALLDDETLLEVEAFSRDEDRMVLNQVAPLPAVAIETSRVKVIKPESWELGQGYNFSGAVNIAVKNEKGNTDKNEFDLDFRFDYRWRANHFVNYGELEYDTRRGVTSSDNWSWFNNYDHTFTGKWYASGSLALKHDRFADLRLRTLFGPGIGYRFFSGKPLNLRAEAGIYYLKDDFYDQPDENFWGLGWYVDYDQLVWKRRLQVYHRQLGFVAADNSSKYLWRAWTGVRAPLIAGLIGSAELEIDYDNDPAVEAETTDQTFRLKLGYKW